MKRRFFLKQSMLATAGWAALFEKPFGTQVTAESIGESRAPANSWIPCTRPATRPGFRLGL
jgi:hypothetical protein